MFTLRVPLLFVLLSIASSCGALNSLDRALTGSQTRAADLDKQVQIFHKGVYWSERQSAAGYVDPAYRAKFLRDLVGPEHQQVIDYTVEDITYDDNNKSAKVIVHVRYYSIPNYVVMGKDTEETWEYRTYAGGWQLMKATDVKAAAAESLSTNRTRLESGVLGGSSY